MFIAVAHLKTACRQENIGTGMKREWKIKRLPRTYLAGSVQEYVVSEETSVHGLSIVAHTALSEDWCAQHDCRKWRYLMKITLAKVVSETT